MGGPSTNFFQKLFQIYKMWLKLDDFQTFFGNFHVFQVVEHIAGGFRMITLKK
jgi:hypothetical protein